MIAVTDRYWGIKSIAAGTGLLGIVSLVFAFSRSSLYAPLGILFFLGAAGLWFQRRWGAIVVLLSWTTGIIIEAEPLAFIAPVVIGLYLYFRKDALWIEVYNGIHYRYPLGMSILLIFLLCLFAVGMSVRMVFYMVALSAMGAVILGYGLFGLFRPRKLATISEQIDALGSQTPFQSIEPTRLNVKMTKASSVMAILIGTFIFAIVFGSVFMYL